MTIHVIIREYFGAFLAGWSIVPALTAYSTQKYGYKGIALIVSLVGVSGVGAWCSAAAESYFSGTGSLGHEVVGPGTTAAIAYLLMLCVNRLSRRYQRAHDRKGGDWESRGK